MIEIFVDADSCPVKPEIYRVAERYGINVILVANSWMRSPERGNISLEVVGNGFDAADDWIVNHVQPDDIVVTIDILLASRCLKKGAQVLGTNGKPFTEDNIGHLVTMRGLMAELREAGTISGGSSPLTKRDRSQFLQQLDRMIQSKRKQTNK